MTVLRDVATFVLGWLLIFQQALFVPPEKLNLAFLFLAASLIGTPATVNALGKIRGGGTPAAPTSPAPSASSSSSPSTSGGTDER
jgi:hypothetical protein